MKSIEQHYLSSINKSLHKLGKSELKGDDIPLEKLRQIDKDVANEVKDMELSAKIERINEREANKRRVLNELQSFSPIDMGIFNNDMSIHKTKARKYPKLMEYIEQNRIRFLMEYGLLSIRVDRETLQLQKRIIEDNTIVPFGSFEEACTLNNIKVDALSLDVVKKQMERMRLIEDNLKLQLKAYDQAKRENDMYFLEKEGIVQSTRIHLSTIYF